MTGNGQSSVELQLFGGPRVVGSEGRIRLSPAQLALLALVHTEEPVTRTRAARVLWRSDDDPKVRHSLRQLLHQTNARLGLKGIETEGDELRAGADLPSDVAEFRDALGSGALKRAAQLLVRGFVSAGLTTVRGDFAEWGEASATGFERRVRELASMKWDDAMGRGAWEPARDAAEALYALSPDDELAVQRAIEARGRVGRVPLAEAAYASYVAGLPPGTEPAEAVRDVIHRVRDADARARADRPASRAPFVGREDALRKGRAALEWMGEGHFSFLLISGESGIGKTRLLEELERDAVMRGFRCLGAGAVELERGVPLNPLLDALREVDLRPHLEELGRPWSTVVSSMLPSGSYDDMVDELPPIQESSLSRRLLDAFALLLEQLALEKPTVLLLDDLHWADATTVAALQFFQRRWTDGPFGIIATVRSEFVDATSPATKYLSDDHGLAVRRVELGDLTHDEAVRLIQGMANGGLGPEPVERLCALAGLHPLYLTELARDYLAGELKLPDVPADEVTIPVSLKQILRSRITHLSDQAMRVAGVLAVAARKMRLGALASLSAMSIDECADCADELERWRLVQVERDTVEISHDLFRSALYRHLSEARRAVWHRKLAEHLLAESPEDSVGELATHFSRAGEEKLAAENGWIAATSAWDRGAMAEAAHFYELVAENEKDPAQRASATAHLAQSLHLNRDIIRANPILELAASRLREVGDDGLARRMEVLRVEGLASVGEAPLPTLFETLDALKTEAGDTRDWEAFALALDVELRLCNRRGDLAGMQKVFAEMRSTAMKGCAAAAVVCHAGLAMQALFGDPREALASAERAVEEATNERTHRLTALLRLMVVLHCRGTLLLNDNMWLIHEARELAQRSGDRRAQFGIESNVALSLLDAGAPEQAEASMSEASKLLGAGDMDVSRLSYANNRAEIALALGQFEEAAKWYQSTDSHLGPNSPSYVRDLVNAGLGLCALETGNLSEARRRELELPEEHFEWLCDPTTILTFRGRLLARRGARPAAIKVLERSIGQLRERHTCGWIKVTTELVRLMIKDGRSEAAVYAEEGRNVAARLGFVQREREFARLAERAAAIGPSC